MPVSATIDYIPVRFRIEHLGEELRAVTGHPGTTTSGIYLDCTASSYLFQLAEHGLDPRILGDEWWYWYPAPGHASAGWPGTSLTVTRRRPGEIIRDWYGIEEREMLHDSTDDLWCYARSVSTQGRSVAVHVDLYHWPPASLFHGRGHGARRVVLSDIGAEGAQVHDGYGEGRFGGWVERSEVLRAVATLESHPRLTVDLPPPRVPLDPAYDDLWDALRSRWRLPTESTASADAPTSGALVGVAAARAFASEVRHRAASGRALPLDEGIAWANALGAVASQRQLGTMFLGLAAERFSGRVRSAADEFVGVARRWFVLYNLFLFGLVMNRPIDTLLAGTADRVDAVIGAEERIISALSDALSSDFGD